LPYKLIPNLSLKFCFCVEGSNFDIVNRSDGAVSLLLASEVCTESPKDGAQEDLRGER
jgi:hypothetical protein